MGEPLYTFKDEFPDPDLISSDYEQFEDTKVPIVIDNGSFHCRAGWASESSPRLIFRNLSAKSKGKRDLELSSVGNNIGNLETVRWALRTQFDRNVVTHFEAQELVFDYIFSHLGIYTSGHVDHPIVITEPVCNPNYCRNLMSELLFECYHVPSVAYGIDGLFSLYYNQSQSRNALVINSGFQSTHILPVLNGKLYASQAKRINVGGNHVISFMQRLLQLKHPAHLQAVTLSRAQELVHDFTYMAVDFMAELNEWKGGAVPDGKLIKIQLPYTELPLMDPEELAQKEEREQERRQTQAQRLREMTSRKRLEKLSELEQQLEYWMSVQAMEDENLDEFYVVLGQLEFESSKDLQSAIDRHRASIEKIQMAIAASEARYEQENEEPTTKRLKDDTSDEPGPVSEQWLKSIRARRQSLIESRQQRQQRRQQLANRRSHASKERMRLIAELAHDDQTIGAVSGRGKERQRHDTFGQNDDDWHVYRTINKEADDSDDEKEESELQQLEQLLRQHDTQFTTVEPELTHRPSIDTAGFYQLHLGIERFRTPEVVYQPSLIGIDQSGITETTQFVLKHFTSEEQQLLVENVFVTGGNSMALNFKERLETELLAIRPFLSKFKVTLSKDPVLDAWLGASRWARNAENFVAAFLTRSDYLEMGGEYLKEHFASNVYVATPK